MEENQWSYENDQKLFYSADEYMKNYGIICNEDWIILARCSFHAPEQQNVLRTRYNYITNHLMVYTFNDYNAFQDFSDENGWVSKRRNWDSMTLRHEMERQRKEIKDFFDNREMELVVRLQGIIPFVNPMSLFSSEFWLYHDGAALMNYMSYVDAVDKFLTRLPDSVMSEIVQCTRDEYTRRVNSDLCKVDEYVAAGKGSSVQLFPEEPIHYKDWGEDIMMRTGSQDTDASRASFGGLEILQGSLKLEEWKALLTLCPFPVWEFLSPVYNDKDFFARQLALLGVHTPLTNTELLLELCSYFLPKVWAGSEINISDVPEEQYQLDDMSTWAATIIYHSITCVSLRHVRKTVLYLISNGQLICCKLTPREWVSKFVQELVRLPGGESWNANPVEFERVRERLKDEILSV